MGKDTLRFWDFANGLGFVPPKATFLRSIRFSEEYRSCGFLIESSLRLSEVNIGSVSVGMERRRAVVGDLVQSESAQKDVVRTQTKRRLEKSKTSHTGPRTLIQGYVSRRESARDHDFMIGL